MRRTTCCSSGQSSVLDYGMKRDFNKWLASLGPAAPVKSLTELREWNTAHERMGAIKYGQSQLDASDKIDLEKDKAKYEEDRARDIRARRHDRHRRRGEGEQPRCAARSRARVAPASRRSLAIRPCSCRSG